MLVGFDTAMFSSTSNSASPCHCHRSFNILVYARVNRISIGIRTCPPNLEKILQLKVYWKTRWNIGVLSPLQKLNPGIDEVLRTIPLIWPDDSASAGHQTRIQVDSFQGGSKANVSFGLADLELLQAQDSEKNTQKYRLKDSKTHQSGGAVEKLRQTDTFSRHGHEICLSSGFTGFGKACSYTRNSSTLMNPMSLLNRMSSHANRRQGAWLQSSKTSSRVNVQHPSMWRDGCKAMWLV